MITEEDGQAHVINHRRAGSIQVTPSSKISNPGKIFNRQSTPGNQRHRDNLLKTNNTIFGFGSGRSDLPRQRNAFTDNATKRSLNSLGDRYTPSNDMAYQVGSYSNNKQQLIIGKQQNITKFDLRGPTSSKAAAGGSYEKDLNSLKVEITSPKTSFGGFFFK